MSGPRPRQGPPPDVQEVAADDLQRDLKTHQAQLRRALERLESQARSQIDLGRIMAEHTAPILLGTFVVGLWVGSRR